MPVAYTSEQQLAIGTRGRDILVSAAAGSGKTAVLTERILQHITGEGSVNVDELLIVTFTEAAAAEMKERIAQKLFERQALDPGNPHLMRQTNLLPSAQVSTIHAFCRKLVKENFQAVDLDPSFKVGDETELCLLLAQALDDAYEEWYSREDNDAFLDLTDAFGGRTRDDRLDDLVRTLLKFIESCPYPESAAKGYADIFLHGSVDLDSTIWVKVIREELSVALNGARDHVKMAETLCQHPGGPEKYRPVLRSDGRLIHELLLALDKPFTELYDMFTGVSFDRLYTYRAKDAIDHALKERVKAIRDKEIKGRLKKLGENYFFKQPDRMASDINSLHLRVKTLMELVLDVRERYANEKRARNLLDFSDLEHYAIQILLPNAPADLTPGPAAERLRHKFREVLIDEYQDSNAVQELILSTVAGQNPRFMVGDVKQSIYRFRRAKPDLFIDKYKRYTRLTEYPEQLQPSEPVRIDLTQNFRSRREVLDAVNFFFSQLMSLEVGEMAYDAQAALYPGAAYPPGEDGFSYETIIDIADAAGETEEAPVPDSEASTDSRFEGEALVPEEDLSLIELEAGVIAKRIRSLVGQRMIWDAPKGEYRPCRLSDIVILTRGVSFIAKPLTEALKKWDVEAIADITTGFFETPEIKTALSFLRVVDNPRQDIDLITVLFSPVYCLTPDELVMLREMDKEADFYECLVQFAEANGLRNNAGETPLEPPSPILSKISRFLADLEKWRTQAVYLPISRLLGIIYDDSRYPYYAGLMQGGRIRQANLRLLLDRAIQYEETSYKGLFHFIRYIENLTSAGGAGSVNAAQSEVEDRVRIMTIHKAKGLEFPIVFVSLLGRSMNREDERRPIVLHQEYGLGPVYTNLEKSTRSNTLARLALSKLSRRESLSEELRVLYVAMTRAKELLILTGCVSGWDEKCNEWLASGSHDDITLPVYVRRGCHNYLDWLMPCLTRHRNAHTWFGEIAKNEALSKHPAGFRLCIHPKQTLSSAHFENAAEIGGYGTGENTEAPSSVSPHMDNTSLCVTYPFSAVLDLPSKVSISELKRQYALELAPESEPLYPNREPVFETPDFFKPTQTEESSASRPKNARRTGTALHTIAEHVDLQTCRTQEAIEGLITSLTERHLLTEEDAAGIDREKVMRFVNGSLSDRMRAAERLYREVPFVMALSPREVFPPIDLGETDETDEKILLHGIIDCFFEENGKIVLVDYKSDTFTGSPRKWAERHRIQMGIYRQAVTEATGMEVSQTLLYSFTLGDAVPVA